MGYPEEESDNKKVDAKEIFLDEISKKSQKVTNLTSNEDLCIKDLKTNGCQSDADESKEFCDTSTSAKELNCAISSAIYEKIDCSNKSCTIPLSLLPSSNEVNNEECLYEAHKNKNSLTHLFNENKNYERSTNEIDESKSNTKILIGSRLNSPSCNTTSYNANIPLNDKESKPCANLKNAHNSSLSSFCSESEFIAPSTNLLSPFVNLTETSENNDEDSSWPCFKISNVISLKESAKEQQCEVDAALNRNVNNVSNEAGKLVIESKHLSSVTDSKKSKGSFADAFLSFVSKEVPKAVNNGTNGEKASPDPENEKEIYFNLENCKRKFRRKKQFSSKEIATMRGYSSRCNSISLFNGKFLSRGNFSSDQAKIDKLAHSFKKSKIIRNSNCNTRLKRRKKGRGRAKKILGLIVEKAKPKNYCVGKDIKKKVLQSGKNFNAMQKIVNSNLPNVIRDKNIIVENDKDSISSIDDVSSNFLDVKDGEKLYSQLIEEAIIGDDDSPSEKSLIHTENKSKESLNVGSDTDSATEADNISATMQCSSESNCNLSSTKLALQRPMSVRRRSPSRTNAINDIEIDDQCCGHWFPTRKSYINHLIEMEADSTHFARLLDNEMIKCRFCPTWTTVNGVKRHLKECSGIKKNSSSVTVSLTTKTSSRCVVDISNRLNSSKNKLMKEAIEVERNSEDVENAESRPCPMSKRLNSSSNASKKIICNLIDDPMASDSVIKIASVSELPNHLKPVIQLSLTENIDKQGPFNSSLRNDLLTCTLSVPLKPISGSFNNSTKNTFTNVENLKHRKSLKNNKDVSDLNPIANETIDIDNNNLAFSTKNESSLNISRFSCENNGSLKKRMRRRRRSSRLSLESSSDRIVGNDSFGRIKFRSSKLKRNRTFRRSGRKVRRCGFHSSETSDGTSSQSDSESSEMHESEFLDYGDVNDYIENIPTVELDLFTIDSFNEEPSVFLTDPTNPNFKVFASMDAIFVGDSALGDVTNQVGYITDVNNVVFVNPSHFLFPKIDENELPNKRGNSKMKKNIVAQNRPLRKAIIPLNEGLRNVKDIKSNSKATKLDEDILAMAAENIKGYDKENLSTINNNVSCKPKVSSLQMEDIGGISLPSKFFKDNSLFEESSKIPSSSAADMPSILQLKPHVDYLSTAIEMNKSAEQPTPITSRSMHLPSPKQTKSTIIVRSDEIKRKIILKNTSNKDMSSNQNVIVIKTSTNKVSGDQGMPRFIEQNVPKLPDVTTGNKNIASVDEVHVLKEFRGAPSYSEKHNSNSPIKFFASNFEQNFNESKTITNLKCMTEGTRIITNASVGKVDEVVCPKDADFVSNIKTIPNQRKSDFVNHDKGVMDVFDDNHCLNDSYSNCIENPPSCKAMDQDDLCLDKALASIDELIYSKECDNSSFVNIRKEFDAQSDYPKNIFSPLKTASDNFNGMKKLTSVNCYQKDDIISLDDAIAALAPSESDKIEECFLSNKKNKIDTVDILDFDAIAISSSHESNSDFTILNPKGNLEPISIPKTTSNDYKWLTTFPNSGNSQSVSRSFDTTNIDYGSTEQKFSTNRSFVSQSLPQIEVVGDSQVVVTSAEITPFETLEGGVCLEDVLENDAGDFEILSMNGFVDKKQNTESKIQSVPDLELPSATNHDINSIPSSSSKMSMQGLTPADVGCASLKEDTNDDSSSSLAESFLNSTFEDIETCQDPLVTSSPTKYTNIFSIADIVKGKNLWDTPLLCSPIKPNLNNMTIPTTPSRLFSRNKLDQLLDVPLSSIPDLLSPSRELSEGFLENGPVELSPNTLSSILSPNIDRKNYNLLSPIVDSTGIVQMAEAPSNFNQTPNKNLRTTKKSAKKNMLHSPKSLDFGKSLDLKAKPRFGLDLSQNSKNYSSTPKTGSKPNLYENHGITNNDVTNELTISRILPKKSTSKLSLTDSLSPSKLTPAKNGDLLSNDLSISKSFTPKSDSFQSSNSGSPIQMFPKIGFLVNNSPLYKSSEKESTNYLHNSSCSDTSVDMSSVLLPGASPTNSSHKKFSGFQPSDPSPSKDSLKTFSDLLSNNFPSFASNSSFDKSFNECNTSNISPSKNSPDIKPSFEGFNSTPELSDRGNASLRMKISLKGINHSKSEASFNNVSDSFITDNNKTSSSSDSCSSRSSSCSSGGSSSSSSSDSEESSDENTEEFRKIVLTQFDSLSGKKKKDS